MGEHVFSSFVNEPTLYYFSDRTGFESPWWQGVRSEAIGEYSVSLIWMIENDIPLDYGDLLNGPVQTNAHVAYYALRKLDGILVFENARISGDQYSFDFYGGQEDVEYLVEVSNDLENWSNSESDVSEPNLDGVRTASFPLGESVCFFRIKFEIDPQ